ncbi:MAG: MFS transporter [Planctomycetes bacterium]|nr:MFS transporter [Planctomycetota bacterium]
MTQATAAAPAPYVRSRLSVMMFLQYATWGAWLPILYAYLSGHLKFTGEQIGYCFSAGAIGAIFGPFIAGQLADRTFATQKLLGVSHLVGAGLVYAMGVTKDFNAFLALSAVYGFVYAPTMALTNSLAFAHLPNRDQDFGPVRVWGTVGWIVVGITVGQVLFRYHTPAGVGADEVTAAQNAGRAVAFQVSAAIGVVMGLYCFTLPDTPPSRNAKQNTAWLEALGEVFRMPLVVLFLVAVPVSIIHQFYFVQADGFIGSVQAKVTEKTWFDNAISQVFGVGGGLMTIGQMTEILVLFAMPFLTKVLSRKQLLLVGLLAYAARMALWAFMPTLPFVIAGIALHGLCFGCFIFVAFMIVDENTTSDVRATAQNLFNLVIVGIGTIVGSIFAANIVGGWASKGGSMDYQKLFSVPMWMALGCFGIMLLAYPSKKSSPGSVGTD